MKIIMKMDSLALIINITHCGTNMLRYKMLSDDDDDDDDDVVWWSVPSA